MKQLSLFCLLVLSHTTIFSQNCDCKKLLTDVAIKVENNYAGYKDKVTFRNKKKYMLHKAALMKVAASNKNDCIDIIYDYLNYFNDPHTILNQENVPLIKDSTLNPKPSNPRLGSVEGIWYNTQNESSIYVKKKGNKYNGYILNAIDSSFGYGSLQIDLKQVAKNKYRIIWHNKYGQKIIYQAHYEGKKLIIPGLTTYVRDGHSPKLDREFVFKSINDTVSYIKFPSFFLFYRGVCDSLVENNRTKIEGSKYLIIDIRNNGGGTIYSFSKIFDYIYTNPTKLISGSFLASADNIDKAKESLNRSIGYLDSAQIASRKKFIAQLELHAGQFYFEPPQMLTRMKIFNSPEKIIILANNNTASAAEMFILMAKQNKKTITVGTYTAGACDYLEPLLYNFCNNDFVIGIPWAKRTRLEYPHNIDNIGIKPDFAVRNKTDDWIEFVLKKIISKK